MFCLFPSFIESEEAGLAPTLDQLIGFCDKLGGMDPGGKLGIWGDCTSGGIPRDLSDFWRRVNEVWRDGRGRMDWGSALKPKGKEKLCVVFADRWIRGEVRGGEEKGRKDADPLRTFERWGGKREGDTRVICPRDGVIYADKSDPDPNGLLLIYSSGDNAWVQGIERTVCLQRVLYIVVPKLTPASAKIPFRLSNDTLRIPNGALV